MQRLLTQFLPRSPADERRRAWAAFLALFGILFAFMLLQTVADTVFLMRLPAAELPWVYVTTAVLATAIATLQARARRSIRSVRSLTTLLFASGFVTVLAWLVVSTGARAAVYGLYVWVGLFGTLATFQLWLVIGVASSVEQAKRVFGFVGAGAVVGSLFGASAAAILTSVLPPRNCLLIAAAAMLMTGVSAARRLRLRRTSDRDASASHDARRPKGRRVLARPYVRGLLALTVLAGITLTLADFWFKHQIAARLRPDQLGPFLGSTYAGLHAVALVAQLGVTSVVLRRIGAPRALWIVPSVVLLGAVGSLLGLVLVGAMLLKGADESLRHTVDSTAHEVLHLAIAEPDRPEAKRVLDIVGRRGAQAAGSFLILGLGLWPDGHQAIPVLLVVAPIVWIGLAVRVRPLYIARFREAIGEGNLERFEHRGPLDLASVEILVRALSSPREATVFAAMDALEAHGRIGLVPTFVLHHPSEAIVLRALELFEQAGRTDFLHVADALHDRSDRSMVRAAALRARTSVEPDPRRLQLAATDPSARVRATALVGLVDQGRASALVPHLGSLLDSTVAKVALAEALRGRACAAFDDVCDDLARDPDAEVREAAAWAIAERPLPRFVPPLIDMLADRKTREAASAALLAVGEPALRGLEHPLYDPDRPQRLRLHVPGAIAAFPPELAIPPLVRQLAREHEGMVYDRILRGLLRLVPRAPDIELGSVLDEAIRAHLALAYEQLAWHVRLRWLALDRDATDARALWLLVEVIADKHHHTVERIFRLLELQRRDEFVRIWHGTRSRRAGVRASSRELLSELLEGDLRQAVLALVDEIEPHRKLAASGDAHRPPALEGIALLEHLAAHTSDPVRAIAARCLAARSRARESR